jgi:hypothetical protein
METSTEVPRVEPVHLSTVSPPCLATKPSRDRLGQFRK